MFTLLWKAGASLNALIFNLPKTNTTKDGNILMLDEHEQCVFDLKNNDWTNPETGEMLARFIPTSELMNLLQNHNDKVCK